MKQLNVPIPNKEYWLEKKAKMDKAIEDYKNINILFASYGQGGYEGDAWVLFEEDGKLFEVNGGHCSCYGLEGQWEKRTRCIRRTKKQARKRNIWN